RVDGNAIQPGKEQRVALEPLQRLVGVEEGLLNNILGILGVDHQSVNGIVEAVLVVAHQYPEGRRVALQTLSDKALVVGTHVTLPSVGRNLRGGSSRNGREQTHLPGQQLNTAN